VRSTAQPAPVAAAGAPRTSSAASSPAAQRSRSSLIACILPQTCPCDDGRERSARQRGVVAEGHAREVLAAVTAVFVPRQSIDV
jgi:hypothetical protein